MKNTNGTYVKMRKKLLRIQKWIYRKEVEQAPKWMNPEKPYIMTMLKELQEILDDEEAKDED